MCVCVCVCVCMCAWGYIKCRAQPDMRVCKALLGTVLVLLLV